MFRKINDTSDMNKLPLFTCSSEQLGTFGFSSQKNLGSLSETFLFFSFQLWLYCCLSVALHVFVSSGNLYILLLFYRQKSKNNFGKVILFVTVWVTNYFCKMVLNVNSLFSVCNRVDHGHEVSRYKLVVSRVWKQKRTSGSFLKSVTG